MNKVVSLAHVRSRMESEEKNPRVRYVEMLMNLPARGGAITLREAEKGTSFSLSLTTGWKNGLVFLGIIFLLWGFTAVGLALMAVGVAQYVVMLFIVTARHSLEYERCVKDLRCSVEAQKCVAQYRRENATNMD